MYIVGILADINFRDPIWGFWIGVGSLVLSGVAILVTIFMTIRNRQRKLLTYEVVSNSSVINTENDVGEDLKILLEGHIVTKVRLHVIKLLNAGNAAISSEDYPNQLSFEFDSPPYPHPLIRCAIHRTIPETLLPAHHLKDLVSIDEPERTMTLKPPLLNPRDAIFLKVLLRANNRDSTTMRVIGQIKDGMLKKYTPPQTRISWRMVVAGVLLAFVLGLLISNSIGLITGFAQGVCEVGSIQDGGSSSFYSTAFKEAQQYNSICPSQIAHIAVSSSSSGEGIAQLERGVLQIANSDTFSSAPNLEDHQVGVLVFVLIINKSVTDISDLTTQNIQNIFNGDDTDWFQINPAAGHLPIKLVERQGSSGTLATFEKYILKGTQHQLSNVTLEESSADVVNAVATTPGAIGYADLGDAASASGSVTILDINGIGPSAPLIENGTYPFWTIEHMYTSKTPDSLSISFIDYVTQNLQTDNSFIRLRAMKLTALASHI